MPRKLWGACILFPKAQDPRIYGPNAALIIHYLLLHTLGIRYGRCRSNRDIGARTNVRLDLCALTNIIHIVLFVEWFMG